MLQENKRKEFESKTVEELRKICKENGISYYENGKRLKKATMIDKLLEFMTGNEVEEVEESKTAEQTVGKTFELPNSTVNDADRIKRKKEYVEQAKVGTLVAFRLPSGKVISAAITKKSTNGRKFLVETKYGAEYKVSFDDVLWVRINKRWPKGVYMLFKRNQNKMGAADANEENS